ncbi:MAG: hypothetical protein GMKNLPBB_02820 [Myxococcota bacterium]|nr:hypothetical protein [Myxococcota bacterium]
MDANLLPPDAELLEAAARRNTTLSELAPPCARPLDVRHLAQMAHLTCPATTWKYVEGAVLNSKANLVVLDLDDSVPAERPDLLEEGLRNIVRAFRTLKWPVSRLRYFRPRGLAEDPRHEDIHVVTENAPGGFDGLVYPKIENEEELVGVDLTLSALEEKHGLPQGGIRVQAMIESVHAEERVFEIARSTPRLSGLIFGAFDYWSSLGLALTAYRPDHPLINDARIHIAKAAASVGVPAIAEMTLNFPTRDKSEAERAAALEDCRRDAILAREQGFSGKWTGIPAQVEIAVEVFTPAAPAIEKALREARAFLDSLKQGKAALMIDGRMADRATDRMNRTLLAVAYAVGRVSEDDARLLGLIPGEDQ